MVAEHPEIHSMRRRTIARAADQSYEAICLAAETMNDEQAPLHMRLRCAEIILDRALGKPKQEINQEVNVNVTHVHLEALKELNAAVIEHEPAPMLEHAGGAELVPKLDRHLIGASLVEVEKLAR